MGVMPKKVKKAKAVQEAVEDVLVSEPLGEPIENDEEVKRLKKEKKKLKKEKKLSAVSNEQNTESDVIENLEKSETNGEGEDMKNESNIENTGANEEAGKDQQKTPSSKVKTFKKRLTEDISYIDSFLSYLHIPNHKRQFGEDDEVEDMKEVPEEARKRLHLNPVNSERASNREELKERLQKKLEELRGTKLGPEDSRRLKKTKKKIAALEKSKDKENLKQKLIQIGANAGNINKDTIKVAEAAGGKASRPSVKTEKGVVFSKFDFQGEMFEKETKKNLDPQAALNKIRKNKEKIKLWEDKGKTEKASKIENNISWQNAMGKAQGEKIKDDEFLLKKSIKRQKQMKTSKEKKWEKRVEGVESQKTAKQTKREENIGKRKSDKKEKKMKHSVAKGRHV